MSPLALQDMSQDRDRDVEIDIDRQEEITKNIPTLFLSQPNNKDQRSFSSNSKHSHDYGQQFLPLPSSKYRYTKWYDVDSMEIKGNMLKSPRIRRAPIGYNISTLQHDQKQKRLNYQSKLECWETCEAVNLSFQELGHSYQLRQFLAVLQKLIRCESLQLMDNGLTDLRNIYLPRCKHLCLQRNYLSNFKKLPKTPMLEHLSLQKNNIASYEGLSALRKTSIVSLNLKDNPIEFDPWYRKRVFQIIPSLQFLDEIPRLNNEESDDITNDRSKCCIS
ncbi:leucine-rich repeat-containing protein 49-like [Xenia sp. Carnegie-2017]|uniref:leucine-rich repeat-containing protein 49-like n=1 Tax=Xenia sp. Carnegie-2017 TaxID=2897299 RepID=UPI001F04559F|nr:leucine-rich repeat-containing protein 49-like [Xenia sp. Carnegie-2017]